MAEEGRLDPKADLGVDGKLSDEEKARLKEKYHGSSLWGIVEQFASSKTPEEAFQGLFINALLFLPNAAVFMLERKAAAMKEKNKKIEEALERFDDVVATSKGLDSTGRLRSVHAEIINASGDMSQLASKLSQTNPKMLEGLNLNFDEKTKQLSGKMDKATEKELRRRVLRQGYFDTYGHWPTSKKLKELESQSNTLDKTGGYKRMGAQAAGVGPNGANPNGPNPNGPNPNGPNPNGPNPNGPNPNGPNPVQNDADSNNRRREEVQLFNKNALEHLGHMPEAAAKLKKEHPEIFEKLGIKFNEDGTVKGNVTDEQIEKLTKTLSDNGYFKEYGRQPSSEELAMIAQGAKVLKQQQQQQDARSPNADQQAEDTRTQEGRTPTPLNVATQQASGGENANGLLEQTTSHLNAVNSFNSRRQDTQRRRQRINQAVNARRQEQGKPPITRAVVDRKQNE